MANRRHNPEEIILFINGCLYSVDAEIGDLISQGHAVDMKNMRLVAMNGKDFVPYNIPGEEVIYGPPEEFLEKDLPTWKCMYTTRIGKYLFEVWCDTLKIGLPFYRINGTIVARSGAILFTVDHGIQGAVDEGAIGMEITLTDYNTTPVQYNIKDLLENAGINFETGLVYPALTPTEKYFINYNYDSYLIQPRTNADIIAFIQVTGQQPAAAYGGSATMLGAGGMQAGMYQYLLRKRTKDAAGAELWSMPTPLICVPYGLGLDDANYPGEKTYGAAAGADTLNGIHLRCRITNPDNYTTCEIRRVRYNSGNPLGSLGTDEIIHQFDIANGEISVRDFWDMGAVGTITPTNDKVDAVGTIAAAKTPRYFDDKLYLMNIKYDPRETDGLDFISDPDVMFPCLKAIGTRGYKNAYSQAYFRSLMGGEKYAWFVVFRDNIGSKQFAVPVPGELAGQVFGGKYNNFQMPNRRDAVVHETQALISNGFAPTASRTDLTTGKCYEVFDQSSYVAKDDECLYKNIADEDTLADGDWRAAADVTSTDITCDGPPTDVGDVDAFGGKLTAGGSISLPWLPFHPTSKNDDDVTGNNFKTNHKVVRAVDANPDMNDTDKAPLYNPQGFAPSYNALGMILMGIRNIPAWATSFSIVRSRAAGRVVMQGLGMYSLIDGRTDVGTIKNASKAKNKLCCYFPDGEAGIKNIQDIIDNPSNYQIQLVSPVGFFTELFNARINTELERDYNIDMISYARIAFEDGTINPGDDDTTVGNNADGYVGYGHWRDAVNGKDFSGYTDKGNNKFDITAITRFQTGSLRQELFTITLSEDVYTEDEVDVVTNPNFDDAGMKKWHEPFYVLNIIRKSADVDTSANQQVCVFTGHYQKLNSIIGRSDGANNNGNGYILVDERREDCIPDNGDGTQNRFVWIEKADGTLSKWINITEKSGGDITDILSDIASATNVSGANADGNLKGVFKQIPVSPDPNFGIIIGNVGVFNIISFDTFSMTGETFIPESGALIRVKYDETAAMSVFGGDVVTGEAVFPAMDNEIPAGGQGDLLLPKGHFSLFIGWPYKRWCMNPRYFMMNKTTAPDIFQTYDEDTIFTLGFIRQMIMMFTCTSRVNLPYSFNNDTDDNSLYQQFPMISYVMRPGEWDATKKPTEQNICKEYETYYRSELDADLLPINWDKGGFRFKQTLQNINIDYSEEQNNFTAVTKPSSGFETITDFPLMIIWSAKRTPGVQNDPGVKTFLPSAFRNISGKFGVIKRAFSGWTEAGYNLYALCERGICLVLTGKFMAREQTGGAIGIIKGAEGDQVILEENWIEEKQGIPDELWRGVAEDGSEFYFFNYDSVYHFKNNRVVDILRGGNYHARIFPDLLKKLQQGYLDDIVGFWNNYNSEYWMAYKKRPIIMGITFPPSPSSEFGIAADVCTGDAAFLLTPPDPDGNFIEINGVIKFGSDYYFDPAVGIGAWVISFVSGYMISTATVTVHALPAVTLSAFAGVTTATPAFTLTGGSPGGGSWSSYDAPGGTIVGDQFDPAVAGAGTWHIVYTVTSEFGCSNSAERTIVVT